MISAKEKPARHPKDTLGKLTRKDQKVVDSLKRGMETYLELVDCKKMLGDKELRDIFDEADDRLQNLAYYLQAKAIVASIIKVQGLEYSPSHVERLSLGIEDSMTGSYNLGRYLSALVNEGKGRKFVIHTGNRPINYIGFMNSKNLVISGNAGDGVGSHMVGGRIALFGNCGEFPGEHIKGGRIIIRGNAFANVGLEGQSGEIDVHGNAGEMVGWKAQRGVIIRIPGGAESISTDTKARIFSSPWGQPIPQERP